ncbi:MAG: hypothetical protein Solumvirus2_58 [Solumvirus sp.]|uniref:Uncharacterized protein n=1 Tax=Solumvirus sp. TaxID=2487773 RepID=A0A3G5AIW5_9VIRU|nr:MAG: hypothetical protein Solumvirus2_58 [Solumvirus sp.]
MLVMTIKYYKVSLDMTDIGYILCVVTIFYHIEEINSLIRDKSHPPAYLIILIIVTILYICGTMIIIGQRFECKTDDPMNECMINTWLFVNIFSPLFYSHMIGRKIYEIIVISYRVCIGLIGLLL